MLNIVSAKLTDIVLNCSDANYMKTLLKGILDDIRQYQDANRTMSDIHGTFRHVTELDTQLQAEILKFNGIESKDYMRRAYHIQEILALISMICMSLNRVLVAYSTNSNDKSQIAKQLGNIHQQYERYKSERMAWVCEAKLQSSIIADITTRNNIAELRVAEQ